MEDFTDTNDFEDVTLEAGAVARVVSPLIGEDVITEFDGALQIVPSVQSDVNTD